MATLRASHSGLHRFEQTLSFWKEVDVNNRHDQSLQINAIVIARVDIVGLVIVA